MVEIEGPGPARVRIGWGVGDQALSSLTNFLLGVAVARSVSATEFGTFSVAYSVFILALGIARSSTSIPLIVRYSGADPDRWRRGAAAATGSGMTIGIAGGLALMGIGLATSGAAGSELVALGVMLPGLLLQDGWRHGFAAEGRNDLAFLNDLVFLLVMAPLLVLLVTTEHEAPAGFILAWGGSATVAAVVAVGLVRVLPDLRQIVPWLRDQGDLAFRYVGEFVAVNGALQITLFLVVALAGFAALGSLRAGFLLFGPVLVIFQSALLFLIPEGIKTLTARGADALRRSVALAALALAGVSVMWGLVLTVVPDDLGQALLGSSWAGARALLLPLTIMFTASGAETAIIVGLRSLAAAKYSLRAHLIEAVLTIVGGAIGAELGGARGAAWGFALIFWVEVAVWWWQFSLALGASPRADVRPGGSPTLGDQLPG